MVPALFLFYCFVPRKTTVLIGLWFRYRPIILIILSLNTKTFISFNFFRDIHRTDSILNAVSLVRNEIPVATKVNSTVNQLALQENQIGNTQTAQAAVTAANAIPQELTTMSDHDLISYINPSCFDQGMFY